MMQLMVWQFLLIVGLNYKCHTCGLCQATWGMAGQFNSAGGIGQFCYRIIITERESKQQ